MRKKVGILAYKLNIDKIVVDLLYLLEQCDHGLSEVGAKGEIGELKLVGVAVFLLLLPHQLGLKRLQAALILRALQDLKAEY